MKTNNLNHFKFFWSSVIFYSLKLFWHWDVYLERSFDPTLAFGVHASERAKLTGRDLFVTLYINYKHHAKPKIN